MEPSLRLEVQEFARACNDLARCAHENNGALTNEECDMVVACIQTLQQIVLSRINVMMFSLLLRR